MRNTSAPASNSAFNCSGDEEDGPSVATIFVFRPRRMRSIRYRLGVIGRLAGIHLEEPFALIAPACAIVPAGDCEFVIRRDAEATAAAPAARAAVRGEE